MYPPNEPKCTRLYPPRVSESTLPYAVFHYMRTWPWLKKFYLQRVRFLPFFSAYVLMVPPQAPMFDPGNTPPGELPPWDVAKAYAFSVVIDKMREVTGKAPGGRRGSPLSCWRRGATVPRVSGEGGGICRLKGGAPNSKESKLTSLYFSAAPHPRPKR